MKAKSKAGSKGAAKRRSTPARKTSTARKAAPDAIAMLKADHRKVEDMFDKYEKLSGGAQKAKLAHEICKELIVHTELEEQIFYPACREAGVEEDMMDEAQVEHDGAKVMILELLGKPGDDDYYDAKVKVLSEYIKHHVKEEEKPGEGVFAQAREAELDMKQLGAEMAGKKQALVDRYDAEKLPSPEFKSFHEAIKAKVAGKGKKADHEPDMARDLTPTGEPRPWMERVARAVR
jgi:hypothetical protein